jgi:hypothetical protein
MQSFKLGFLALKSRLAIVGLVVSLSNLAATLMVFGSASVERAVLQARSKPPPVASAAASKVPAKPRAGLKTS